MFTRLSVAAMAIALLSSACSATDASEGAETSADALTSEHLVEAPPPEALRDDTFYVTLFAYQSGNNIVSKESSHTFAQFVHARPDGAGGVHVRDDDTDRVVISWMPHSGVVRPFGPMEQGEDTALDFEMRRGAGVSRARGFVWGPFRIPRAIFDRATKQRELLRSGSIAYRASERDPVSRDVNYIALAPNGPRPQFLNCLAAVGDIAPTGGTVVGASSGRGGTQEIADHFAPYILDREGVAAQAHDRHRWVARELNLARFQNMFPGGLELQEQPGHNPRFATCFCRGDVGRRAQSCSFYGVPAGVHGAVRPVVTIEGADAAACASGCSADWSEWSEACGGQIKDTGAP